MEFFKYALHGNFCHFSGLFVMEADTGRLTVTSSLDREKRDRYSLKVRAENVGRHRYGREVTRSGKYVF